MKWITVLVAASLVACSAAPNLDVERTAIMRTDSAWLAAAHARNTDSTVTFWTADARVIGAGEAPKIGRDAIRKMVASGFASPVFTVDWHTSDVVVAPSGDVAYSFGTNMFTVPGAGTQVDTLRGQAVVVWRKGEDGRWRAAVDTWTPQAR